jgi:hypothetical protein
MNFSDNVDSGENASKLGQHQLGAHLVQNIGRSDQLGVVGAD